MTMKVGEVLTNREGQEAVVIKYIDSRSVRVRFKSTGSEEVFRAYHLRMGQFKDKYFPSVCGVGYLGEAKSSVNGRKKKSYSTWNNMLIRCYDSKRLKKSSSYMGCTVQKDWLCFEVFERWFDENYIEGYHLDKDIMVKGNKVYGKEYCCFVPSAINNAIIQEQATERDLPSGVNLLGGNYYQTSVAKRYIGIYRTPEEASNAYIQAKKQYVTELAKEYYDKRKISKGVYDALRKRYE